MLGKNPLLLTDPMENYVRDMQCSCVDLLLHGGQVRLQPFNALSTMEAEYMALCVATQEVIFLRQLLTELSVVLKHPTSMMQDNNGCVSYAKNFKIASKLNHIHVKIYFIRDAIRARIIVVQWCSTHDMICKNSYQVFVTLFSSTFSTCFKHDVWTIFSV